MVGEGFEGEIVVSLRSGLRIHFRLLPMKLGSRFAPRRGFYIFLFSCRGFCG